MPDAAGIRRRRDITKAPSGANVDGVFALVADVHLPRGTDRNIHGRRCAGRGFGRRHGEQLLSLLIQHPYAVLAAALGDVDLAVVRHRHAHRSRGAFERLRVPRQRGGRCAARRRQRPRVRPGHDRAHDDRGHTSRRAWRSSAAGRSRPVRRGATIARSLRLAYLPASRPPRPLFHVFPSLTSSLPGEYIARTDAPRGDHPSRIDPYQKGIGAIRRPVPPDGTPQARCAPAPDAGAGQRPRTKAL
jgi:hypothetical protein